MSGRATLLLSDLFPQMSQQEDFGEEILADRFRAAKSIEPQEDWINFELPWDDLDDQGDIISPVSFVFASFISF